MNWVIFLKQIIPYFLPKIYFSLIFKSDKAESSLSASDRYAFGSINLIFVHKSITFLFKFWKLPLIVPPQRLLENFISSPQTTEKVGRQVGSRPSRRPAWIKSPDTGKMIVLLMIYRNFIENLVWFGESRLPQTTSFGFRQICGRRWVEVGVGAPRLPHLKKRLSPSVQITFLTSPEV